jgi:hypothetical protein
VTAKTSKSKRGGPRPGSGRPKGAKSKSTIAKEAVLTEVLSRAIQNETTPLEVMLTIMRDPESPPAMKFEAAKAAAPYVHPRLSQVDSTVTHKRDVAELTTAELDELLAAELAAGKARTARGHRDAGGVH